MAVADDVGREDRGQLSFDYLGFYHPGGLPAAPVSVLSGYYRG
jgi:hypothetical protein